MRKHPQNTRKTPQNARIRAWRNVGRVGYHPAAKTPKKPAKSRQGQRDQHNRGKKTVGESPEQGCVPMIAMENAGNSPQQRPSHPSWKPHRNRSSNRFALKHLNPSNSIGLTAMEQGAGEKRSDGNPTDPRERHPIAILEWSYSGWLKLRDTKGYQTRREHHRIRPAPASKPNRPVVAWWWW